MTDLMQTFIERLKALPEAQQDRYAAVYLAALDDDQRRERLLDETGDAQGAKLTAALRAEAEGDYTIKQGPQDVAEALPVSAATLRMIDRSVQNFSEGVAGAAVDLDDVFPDDEA
jgi:hypothetical protein